VEKLLVDLMMHERLEGFRSVQRMCCEALLTGLDKRVLVKAVMGCGKTLAMVVSILTEQEKRRRAGLPLPVCCIVVRQLEVGRTLVGSCHRGLLNHDIYTDFESNEDFTTWARDTTKDNTFEAVDYSFEEEINKDMDGWELGLHQGPTPGSKGRVEEAKDALGNEIHRQRLFLGNPKRRRIAKKCFEPYRRPTLKKLEELPTHIHGRGATIIITYNSLSKILEYCGDGFSLGLVLLDESHVIANNTNSTAWKADATQLCRSADRVVMFSGTPICRNGRRDPENYLEIFRSGALRLMWTEIQALEAKEIVPCKVVLGDSNTFLAFLRDGKRRQDVWSEVSAVYLSMFEGAPSPKNPEVDVALLVFSLVRMVVLHAEYLSQPEESMQSPCANVLIETPLNFVGLAMEKLLLHLKEDQGVREEWFVPLFRVFGEDRIDAVACSDALRQRLCVACPNSRRQSRKQFIEDMSAWEVEGNFKVLLASKWPFEGTDMPHLHAVIPYPQEKRQDNIFDQMRARPCRAVPRKKHGYLLMMNFRRIRNIQNEDSEAHPEDAGSTSSGRDTSMDDGDTDSLTGAEEAMSHGGPGEEQLRPVRRRVARDAVDAEDCKGVGLRYTDAVALASAVGGGVLPCPLMMTVAPSDHRKLMKNLQESRQVARRELRFWEECAPFDIAPQRSPLALVVLFEYKTRVQSKVVAGLLTPRASLDSRSISHLYVELVHVFDRLPSCEEVLAEVHPMLDGSRHGFLVEDDQIRCCESDGPFSNHFLCFRSGGPDRLEHAPLELSAAPSARGTVSRKAWKEFYGMLANFDGGPRAFLLGSPDEVLVLSQKSSSDGNLAFSTNVKASVSHLFMTMPMDLSKRPAVPMPPGNKTTDLHKRLVNQLLFERKTKLPTQIVPYLADVVLLALVQIDGAEGMRGLVECNPEERQYGRILKQGRIDGPEGFSSEYLDPCVWQLEDVDVLTDTFRICRNGKGWVCPAVEDSNGAAMFMGDSPSTFTRHRLPKNVPCFELACGPNSTKGFSLVTERVPVGIRIQPRARYVSIFRAERETQWFSFPRHWLQGNPTVQVRMSTPEASNSTSSGGYDATHFGEDKHAGKDKVNRFLRQIALRTDGMALLLDDVDPRSRKLRSAEELGKAFPLGSIIVPNPDESIVQIAQRMGLRGTTKTWAEALDDLPAERTLGVAYYDNCDQGAWSVSEENLKKVFPHMLEGGVLACTLLGRNFVAPLHERRSLCDGLMLENDFEKVQGFDGKGAEIKYDKNLVLFYKKIGQ
jgi:hypothetical protein